jgi:hypothetical protein
MDGSGGNRMRPYKDIYIGDIYKPRSFSTIDYIVVNKNNNEKMIELKCSYQNPHLPETIWKKNTDSIFNYRVFSAYKPNYANGD